MKNRDLTFFYVDNYTGMLMTDDVYKHQSEAVNKKYRDRIYHGIKNSCFFIIVVITHLCVWLCWTDSPAKTAPPVATLEISFVSPPENTITPSTVIIPAQQPRTPIIEKKETVTSHKSDVTTKQVFRQKLKIKKISIDKSEKKTLTKNENQKVLNDTLEHVRSKQINEAIIEPVKFNAGYLNNPKPDYPDASVRLHEEGVVILKVAVAASGHAEKIVLEKSSGFGRLDVAAQKAVYGWTFIPAMKGTEKIFSWILVPVKFKLEDV
jgi:TonB family C-terminal domain